MRQGYNQQNRNFGNRYEGGNSRFYEGGNQRYDGNYNQNRDRDYNPNREYNQNRDRSDYNGYTGNRQNQGQQGTLDFD
jgi:hypothetical protein